MFHNNEFLIDEALVEALVDRALPEYAGMEVRSLSSSGSSNALFRLGDDLLVRMPRQPGGSTTIAKEALWLPRIAPQLSVEVPRVVAVGEPALGYPECWSVTTWLDGEAPQVAKGQDDRRPLAEDLAAMLGELRALDVPDEARADPRLRWYRGEPLSELDADFREAVADCRALPTLRLDLDAALEVWGAAVDASRKAQPRQEHWLHGDLLAENLLVEGSHLSAVLDFGGLAIGDPTVDLVVAWEVLDAESRAVFRRALDVDDATWLCSMGWALLIAMITFPYYWATMPQRCSDRLTMARAVLDQPAAPKW